MVADGVHTYYGYDAANKMTSPGTFDYDVKGNMHSHIIDGVTTEYTWDLQNRMVQWEKTNETTETYLYNADGMRVRKTPNGGTQTDFLLDIDEIAEEITGSSIVSYVGPQLISRIDGETRTIYHADGIGSTRALSDSTQAVAQAEIYDAYGNRLTTSGQAPNFGFAGEYRYYADATGLDYLKARYYDSTAGRFISRDPMGYWGGFNLYAYGKDRPTSFVDPRGLFEIDPGDSNESCKKGCKEGYEDCKDIVGFGVLIGTGAAAGAGVVCSVVATPVVGGLVAGGVECCVLTAGGSTWAGCFVGYKRCLRDCDELFPPPNCSGGGGNPGGGSGW